MEKLEGDKKHLSWKEKMGEKYRSFNHWMASWKILGSNISHEITNSIHWTNFGKLLEYIRQFMIITTFSMICLFIMDNFIIFCLKKIFA